MKTTIPDQPIRAPHVWVFDGKKNQLIRQGRVMEGEHAHGYFCVSPEDFGEWSAQ